MSRICPTLVACLSLCLVVPMGSRAMAGPRADVEVDPAIPVALRERGEAICFVNCRGLRAAARGDAAEDSSGAAALVDVEQELAGLAGGQLCHRFRTIPSLLYRMTEPACLEALRRHPAVESIVLDQPGGGLLVESLPAAGFGAAAQARLRGAGRTIAVLDTGVDRHHRALAGAVVHEYHFLQQATDAGSGAMDDHGHGTHVAGILASRGGEGAPVGIAPESQLVVIKVLDAKNRGWISDWTMAIEHVVELDAADNGIDVDVINMSFGTDTLFSGVCDSALTPFFAACRRAVERGIAVVAAAGNRAAPDGLPAPACYSPVIAVGSVPETALGQLSEFTNRSSELELLAPGEPIVSTALRGSTTTLRGTSQATPHVAGLIGLLREAGVGSVELLRDLLRQTATPVFDARSQRSYPLIDAARAIAVAQVPQVSELSCTEAGDGLEVAWRGSLGVSHYRLVIVHAAETVLETELAGGETSFRLQLDRPGVVNVSLQPFDERGQGGIALACETELRHDEVRFVRGECNRRGSLDVSDPLFLVNFLFSGGPSPSCLNACNGNGDTDLNVADVVYVLHHLFLGGARPLAPFPACGVATAHDSFGCEVGYCP